jgi:hypothetical protein
MPLESLESRMPEQEHTKTARSGDVIASTQGHAVVSLTVIPQNVPSSGITIFRLLCWLALGVPISYILLTLAELSSYVWTPLSISLYVVLIMLAILVMRGINSRPSVINAMEQDFLYELSMTFTIMGFILAMACFSQICRHLYILFGGFDADNADYWHWLRFGVSNLLDSTLFDVPDIFEWNFSEIKATSFWSRTIVFIFRTSLEFLIIAGILRQVGVARNNWQKPSVSKSSSYIAFVLSKLLSLLLACVCLIPIAVSVGAIANDGLSLEASWQTTRFAALIVLGLWLSWYSLLAIKIAGRWNKLLSLGGIALGIWVIRLTLRAFLGQ